MYETCVEFTTKPLGITDNLDKDWGYYLPYLTYRPYFVDPYQSKFRFVKGRDGPVQYSVLQYQTRQWTETGTCTRFGLHNTRT